MRKRETIRVIGMLRLLAVTVIGLLSALAMAQEPQAALILRHDSGLVTAAWNDAESEILTATEKGLLRVWSADSGEALLSLRHGSSPLTHALWLPGGGAMLAADESGVVSLIDRADGATRHSWQMLGMPVALALNEAASAALVFTDQGDGALLSLEDGGRPHDFDADAQISGAAFSADESRVRAWSEAGGVYSWQLETGAMAEARPPHRGLLLGLLWNSDESRVLAWFADGIVNVYESDGESIGRRRISGLRHSSFAQQAIWSADESEVMSWAGDDTLHIWSADSGRSRAVLRHEDWVIGGRWDPAERRVLSWSHIYVYLWQNEREWQRFRHGNLVRGASWDGDARRILSWSWDGTARVWEAG